MITLKNLNSSSKQDIFNQVVSHLLIQNKKSGYKRPNSFSSHKCFYRYKDLKCAAGCLIADDEYTDKMEGKDWSALIDDFNLNINHTHTYLITDLQNIHDYEPVSSWHSELKSLAKKYKLKFNISILDIN